MMNKRKQYKLTKNVKTLKDLFSKDDIRTFLNGFITRDLPHTKSLVLIFADEDNTVQVGCCGVDSRELHGMLIEALFDTLTEEMVEGEPENDNGLQES